MRELSRREVIRLWQEAWDGERTGRDLHSVLPKVRWGYIGWEPRAVQLITRHGYLKAYYRRVRVRNGDGTCDCGNGEETAEHVLWRCAIEVSVKAREGALKAELSLEGTN